MSTSNMLVLDGLSVDIGGMAVLRNASLEIPDRAMVGLHGGNGAGKTTLLRSIMGLIAKRSGRIMFEGMDLSGVRPHQRSHLGIGYMPEDRRLASDFSAEDNILVPAWAGQLKNSRERLEHIYQLMSEVKPVRHTKATQLSGGQQKLVALARALMAGRKLLLLDEPFEGLAPALARRLAEVIGSLKATGLSILLAESSSQHATDLLDVTYTIERGEVRPGELGRRDA
jgi:branched-chain amino acid transport system ATP-binding protein